MSQTEKVNSWGRLVVRILVFKHECSYWNCWVWVTGRQGVWWTGEAFFSEGCSDTNPDLMENNLEIWLEIQIFIMKSFGCLNVESLKCPKSQICCPWEPTVAHRSLSCDSDIVLLAWSLPEWKGHSQQPSFHPEGLWQQQSSNNHLSLQMNF